jgi:hypothetical protein
VRMSKPARPEVICASIVLVSHLGQGGRLMIMVLALDEAGALPNSQSPMGAIGGTVMGPTCASWFQSQWSIPLTIQKKLMRR